VTVEDWAGLLFGAAGQGLGMAGMGIGQSLRGVDADRLEGMGSVRVLPGRGILTTSVAEEQWLRAPVTVAGKTTAAVGALATATVAAAGAAAAVVSAAQSTPSARPTL